MKYLKYSIITVYSHIFGYLLLYVISWIASSAYKSGIIQFTNTYVIIMLLLGILIAFISTAVVCASHLYRFVLHKLNISDDRRIMSYSFLKILIPGEILRLIITSIPWNKGWFTSHAYIGTIINIEPTLFFDQFYLTLTRRILFVSEYGIRTSDYFIYSLINVFFFVLHIAITLLLLLRISENEKRNKNKEIRLTMHTE